MARPRLHEPEPAGRGVTRRETLVLDLVVARYSNAEIAVRLGISKRTVESHMAALLRKFSVADRRQLIRAAAPTVRAERVAKLAPRTTPRTPSIGVRAEAIALRRQAINLRHRSAQAHQSSLRHALASMRVLEQSRAMLNGDGVAR